MIVSRSVAEVLVGFFTPLRWSYESARLEVDWRLSYDKIRLRMLLSVALTFISVCFGFLSLISPIGLPLVQMVMSFVFLMMSVAGFAGARLGMWASKKALELSSVKADRAEPDVVFHKTEVSVN